MLGDVKRDDANRVAVLSGHQIADRRFEIGLRDIGLGECEANVGPVIVDNDIKIQIVTAWHDRWSPSPAHAQLPTQHREFKHETDDRSCKK